MPTPTIRREYVRPTVRPLPQRPVKLDPEVLRWEREVYDADPTGGAPSRY